MSELPRGWSDASLAELCGPDAPVVYGIIQPGPDVPNGIPYVRPTELVDGRIDVANLRKTAPEIAREYERATLMEGDIILAIVGTIGKLAIVPMELTGANITQSSARIRPPAWMPAQYLAYALKSPAVQAQYDQYEFGNAVRRLNVAHVRTLRVPVPPPPEQRRIVSKIDSLNTRSRRAKEALDDAHCLEAKLVEYYTSNWPETMLGEHIESRNEVVGKTWRDYPTVGLSNEGEMTARRENIGAKTAEKCKIVRHGDIVFNPIRFSIGSIARYYGAEPAIVSPEYQTFRCKPSLSSEVLVRYLRTSRGRSFLDTQTQGSVRYRVYFRTLEQLRLQLAPPDIQQRAERLFMGLRRVWASTESAADMLKDLDRAILAKAFRGELVPQDPNDEPAPELLARIRASRDEASASGPKRKQGARGPRASKESSTMAKTRNDEDVRNKPYLAGVLKNLGGSANAEALFNVADLGLADFYKQLSWEIDQGYVRDAGKLLEVA